VTKGKWSARHGGDRLLGRGDRVEAVEADLREDAPPPFQQRARWRSRGGEIDKPPS
jgi:hypothetical protein